MRLLIASLLCVIGCSQPNLEEPASPESSLFGPSSMRIHRIFSGPKDWTGDNNPDGIEVVIEFKDQFGDATKAAGEFTFELYDYRVGDPEPRGFRVVNPWKASIATERDQRNRFNRVSHTYSFRLAYPAIKATQSYVLTAQFDPITGERYFDRIILPATEEEVGPTTQPTSRPSRGLFGF